MREEEGVTQKREMCIERQGEGHASWIQRRIHVWERGNASWERERHALRERERGTHGVWERD